MQDHQITLREAKAAQEGKAGQGAGQAIASATGSGSGNGVNGVNVETTAAAIPAEAAGRENPSISSPSTSMSVPPTAMPAPSSSSLTRHSVQFLQTPTSHNNPPNLTPLQRLLTSPLTSYPILPAPLKLLFHLFQLLLVPSEILSSRNFPTSLNTLLFLDTAIWFISVIGIWLIGGKALRLAGVARRGKRVGKVGRLLAEGGTAVGAGVMEALPRRDGDAGRTPTNARVGLADGAGAPRAVHTGQPEINPHAQGGNVAGQGMEERAIDPHAHGHGHGNEANIRQRTAAGVGADGGRMRGAAVGREDL